MNQMDHFAETVAQKRKEKNMTQEALAKRLRISPQAISKWETGQGLPDVTLFPLLAEVLEVSLEELFGMEKPETVESVREQDGFEFCTCVPKTYGGLPLAGSGIKRACYSQKEVAERKGERILFADGSEADLEGGWSTNRGKGDIRIYKIEEIGHFYGPSSGEEEDPMALGARDYENFPKSIHSLYFSLAHPCTLRILKGSADALRMQIKGTRRFLKALTVEHDKAMLTVRVKSPINGWSGNLRADRCVITLCVPFEKGKKLHVSLYGNCSSVVESDFEEGELKIAGSGGFTVGSFEKRLEARIMGSGDIKGVNSLGSTKLRISGSGDIRLASMNNIDAKVTGSGDIWADRSEGKGIVRVSGSGDVRIDEVRGELDVKISGCGDLNCGGTLDKLIFFASGSGALKAGGLTVKDAELHTTGTSDISIGCITGSSKEKLSKNTVIRIGTRG